MLPRHTLSSIKAEFLNTFANELDTLIKTPKNMEKTIRIMEKLLAEDSIESMQIPKEENELVTKVTKIQDMMTSPNLEPLNTVAIGTLRGEMQGMVKVKAEQLKKLKPYKELCQRMVPGLPSDEIKFFITTVEGFYQKGLLENVPSEKALVSALAKWAVLYFISNPNFHTNTALKRALEADPKLKDYVCGISLDLVGSDAVFLSGEDTANSPQRYHLNKIEDWLNDNSSDPITRAKRTIENVVKDPNAEMIIKNAARAWIDGKMKEVPSSLEVRVPWNKCLLLADGAAYPLVRKQYYTVIKDSCDTEKTIEEVETFAEEVIGRCISLVEGMSAYVEQIPPPCYPYVKEFIRKATEKVGHGVPLEEVKSELGSKIGVFIDFFRRTDSTPLSTDAKKGAFAVVEKAINEESPLDQIESLFLKYMSSIELQIRNECPGCLMGEKEWSLLAMVEKIPPLTEEILKALHQPSPSDPAKEAWQTGLLVLVPETINGKPFTLNSLGDLVQYHLPQSTRGYRFLEPPQAGEISAGKSSWVLIEKNVLPNSTNKNFGEQEAMINPPYEAPELLPMAAGIILNYLNSENYKHLFNDPWVYTNCKETIRGHHLQIGGFQPNGIGVGFSSLVVAHFGIGAQRKLTL